MSDYVPHPLPEDGRELTPELSALVETLAENAHEIWAHERIRGGWRYGPRRDDEARIHPSLIPYRDLPEQEKDIDRAMVEGTIRVILHLGFAIEKT